MMFKLGYFQHLVKIIWCLIFFP